MVPRLARVGAPSSRPARPNPRHATSLAPGSRRPGAMYTHSLTTLRQCLRLRFACSHHDERDTVTRPGRGERRPGREHAASAIVCKDDQSRRSIRFITIWIEKDKIRFIYPCSLVPFGRNPLASRYTSALSFRDAGGLINSPPALKSGFTRFKRGASSDPCRSFVSQCPPGRRQRCAKLMLCSA